MTENGAASSYADLRRRLTRLKGKNIEAEFYRIFLERLRSDQPLLKFERDLIAGTLEEFLFPPTKREGARRRRQFEARTICSLIEMREEQLRDEGSSQPSAEAHDWAAGCYGHGGDGDSLARWLRRNR